MDEFDDEGRKRRRDDKVASCSQWTKQVLTAFQMYFVPMTNWNAIIPQEHIPTRAGNPSTPPAPLQVFTNYA